MYCFVGKDLSTRPNLRGQLKGEGGGLFSFERRSIHIFPLYVCLFVRVFHILKYRVQCFGSSPVSDAFVYKQPIYNWSAIANDKLLNIHLYFMINDPFVLLECLQPLFDLVQPNLILLLGTFTFTQLSLNINLGHGGRKNLRNLEKDKISKTCFPRNFNLFLVCFFIKFTIYCPRVNTGWLIGYVNLFNQILQGYKNPALL